MSHLSSTVTHNEYTSNPTGEKEFDTPASFSSIEALKEGFFAPYKSNKPGAWVIFTLVGLVISIGVMSTSSLVATASVGSDPGTATAIMGDVLAFIAVLIGFYFFFGLTQGFIRGTHFTAPHYNDLFISNVKTILRSYGATLSLAVITLLLVLPMLMLNALIVIVGVPVPVSVHWGILILAAVLLVLLRIFSAYTIYAIIDSNMKVLDAFILSLKLVSRNFLSSILLFVFTTLILLAPTALIVYLPFMLADNLSSTTLAVLAVVSGVITLLLFPVTQASYVYSYRKSTHGPVPINGSYTTDGDMISLASEDTEVIVDSGVDVHIDEEADSIVEEKSETENFKTSIDVTDKDGDGKITKVDETSL